MFVFVCVFFCECEGGEDEEGGSVFVYASRRGGLCLFLQVCSCVNVRLEEEKWGVRLCILVREACACVCGGGGKIQKEGLCGGFDKEGFVLCLCSCVGEGDGERKGALVYGRRAM